MKMLRIAVLIVFGGIWLLGVSDYEKVFPYLYRWGLIEDEYRYGDLFNLSKLPQFKEEMVKCTTPFPLEKKSDCPLHLYALGDSFLEPQRIDSSDFIADAFHFVKWDNYLHFNLDTSALNVVLIESIERHLRQHFETPVDHYFVPDSVTYVRKWKDMRWMSRLDDFFRSSRAEDQLSLIISSNRLGIAFKELKSSLNFNLFDRTESGVTVSDDKKHIVYYLDTDTLNYPITSGFAKISDSRIDSVVNAINQTATQLKAMGFDHLIISIIPNKSTILMPDYGTYNHLVERIQSHPDLSTPFVSIINEYRALGEKSFLHSDSHWTCEGRAIWVKKTNELLQHLLDDPENLPPDCMAPGSTRNLLKASM